MTQKCLSLGNSKEYLFCNLMLVVAHANFKCQRNKSLLLTYLKYSSNGVEDNALHSVLC